MFHEPHQPLVIECVEEAADIRIQDPTHLLLRDPHPQRIKSLVLAAARAEPVAEAGEVLLVDRVQDPHRGLLDDLVLQGRDAQRAHAPVGFRDPRTLRGLRTVATTLHALVQSGDTRAQILAVGVPRHAVHSRGRGALERIKGFRQ